MTQPQQPDQAQQQFLTALAAYQAASASLRVSLTSYVERLWRSLGSWRQKDIAGFVRDVTPVVAGAQRQMLSLTSAWYGQQQQIALGGRFVPAAVDPAKVTGAAARHGTSPAEVYERPFHLVWRQLDELPHEPGSIDKAIESGMNRAVQSAVTDVQLTKVQTGQAIRKADPRVVGVRRVLEGAYSCGLCIVAATRLYHKHDLLGLHPACDCSEAPVYGESDPGEVIQAAVRNGDGAVTPIADLPDVHDRLYEQFGSASSAAGVIRGARNDKGDLVRYRDVLVTHEHGELGPVLAVRGAKFAGPDDL